MSPTEYATLIVLGYLTNVLFYFAFCQNEIIAYPLPQILMPALIVPFLPMLIMSILMVGLILAMIISVILMGVLSIIIGIMGLCLLGKHYLYRFVNFIKSATKEPKENLPSIKQ